MNADTIPFKAWKIERARQLKITVTALNMRLSNGKEPYPDVVRKNQRVIEVVCEGEIMQSLTEKRWQEMERMDIAEAVAQCARKKLDATKRAAKMLDDMSRACHA